MAITVPGRGNKVLGFLLELLGDAIARMPDNIKVENTFFDFETSTTSAEIVVTDYDLTVDQVAADAMAAVSAAAHWHAQQHSTHPTGVRTHAVQVIP